MRVRVGDGGGPIAKAIKTAFLRYAAAEWYVRKLWPNVDNTAKTETTLCIRSASRLSAPRRFTLVSAVCDVNGGRRCPTLKALERHQPSSRHHRCPPTLTKHEHLLYPPPSAHIFRGKKRTPQKVECGAKHRASLCNTCHSTHEHSSSASTN